jgi:hypothetical protein
MAPASEPRAPWNRKGFVIVAFVVAALAASGATRAEGARIEGTYRYTGTIEQGRRVIVGAFAGPLESIPSVFRSFVRRQLFKADPMVARFTIGTEPGVVVFRAYGKRTTELRLPEGVPREVELPSGQRARVVHRIGDMHYQQEITGRRTRQRARFTLAKNGRTLLYDTDIAITFFDEPVRFTLLYRRES